MGIITWGSQMGKQSPERGSGLPKDTQLTWGCCSGSQVPRVMLLSDHWAVKNTLAFFVDNQRPLLEVSSCHTTCCKCWGPWSRGLSRTEIIWYWWMQCVEKAVYQLSSQYAGDGPNGLSSSVWKCQRHSTRPINTTSEALIFLRAEVAGCVKGDFAVFIIW